ncbi:MAG: OsmC family peroxiredoxin [Caldithrix sp.]|nr:OsmC family peroxiredoxin [Caldithrix sp.]
MLHKSNPNNSITKNDNTPTDNIDVAWRQDPLRQRYTTHPEEAIVTDWARTNGNSVSDAFHGWIDLGESTGGAHLQSMPASVKEENYHYGMEWPTGIHRAIGGDHDLPNPGNLLAGALATCFDSTLRMIANRLGIVIESLSVTASATADTRGTLVIDRDVPVAFQNMTLDIHIKPADGTDSQLVKKLYAAAEYSCVNLKTLLSGVPVDIRYHTETR